MTDDTLTLIGYLPTQGHDPSRLKLLYVQLPEVKFYRSGNLRYAEAFQLVEIGEEHIQLPPMENAVMWLLMVHAGHSVSYSTFSDLLKIRGYGSDPSRVIEDLQARFRHGGWNRRIVHDERNGYRIPAV